MKSTRLFPLSRSLSRRDWSRKQEELKEALFVEVKNQHQRTLWQTPEYEGLSLQKNHRRHREFAGNDEILYLSFQQLTAVQRLDALIQKTGISLQVSEEDFIGGIRARDPGTKIS